MSEDCWLWSFVPIADEKSVQMWLAENIATQVTTIPFWDIAFSGRLYLQNSSTYFFADWLRQGILLVMNLISRSYSNFLLISTFWYRSETIGQLQESILVWNMHTQAKILLCFKLSKINVQVKYFSWYQFLKSLLTQLQKLPKIRL